MDRPAYWAKIALDLPDLTVELPVIDHDGALCLLNTPGRQLTDFCLTLARVMPEGPSAPLHSEPRWLEYNATFSPISVLCQKIKVTKTLHCWKVRTENEGRRLQCWVVEDRDHQEEFWLYIAADTEDDFEFMVRFVTCDIEYGLLSVNGPRYHECSPLAIRNHVFSTRFGRP